MIGFSRIKQSSGKKVKCFFGIKKKSTNSKEQPPVLKKQKSFDIV